MNSDQTDFHTSAQRAGIVGPYLLGPYRVTGRQVAGRLGDVFLAEHNETHQRVSLKIFPASLGGPAYIRALKQPLPHIPMIPTGGVDDRTVGDFFKAGAFAVGAGGSCRRKRGVGFMIWTTCLSNSQRMETPGCYQLPGS